MKHTARTAILPVCLLAGALLLAACGPAAPGSGAPAGSSFALRQELDTPSGGQPPEAGGEGIFVGGAENSTLFTPVPAEKGGDEMSGEEISQVFLTLFAQAEAPFAWAILSSFPCDTASPLSVNGETGYPLLYFESVAQLQQLYRQVFSTAFSDILLEWHLQSAHLRDVDGAPYFFPPDTGIGRSPLNEQLHVIGQISANRIEISSAEGYPDASDPTAVHFVLVRENGRWVFDEFHNWRLATGR